MIPVTAGTETPGANYLAGNVYCASASSPRCGMKPVFDAALSSAAPILRAICCCKSAGFRARVPLQLSYVRDKRNLLNIGVRISPHPPYADV
jgi:hypothetical protein